MGLWGKTVKPNQVVIKRESCWLGSRLVAHLVCTTRQTGLFISYENVFKQGLESPNFGGYPPANNGSAQPRIWKTDLRFERESFHVPRPVVDFHGTGRHFVWVIDIRGNPSQKGRTVLFLSVGCFLNRNPLQTKRSGEWIANCLCNELESCDSFGHHIHFKGPTDSYKPTWDPNKSILCRVFSGFVKSNKSHVPPG